jgi:hypothetical protein
MKEYRVFVKDVPSLAELVRFVAAFLNSSLSETETSGLFRGCAAGCIIDVFDDHGFVDDGGIPFTNYKFEIVLEPLEQLEPITEPGNDLRHQQEGLEQKAMELARTICATLSTRCMVVRGLQTIVGTC